MKFLFVTSFENFNIEYCLLTLYAYDEIYEIWIYKLVNEKVLRRVGEKVKLFYKTSSKIKVEYLGSVLSTHKRLWRENKKADRRKSLGSRMYKNELGHCRRIDEMKLTVFSSGFCFAWFSLFLLFISVNIVKWKFYWIACKENLVIYRLVKFSSF